MACLFFRLTWDIPWFIMYISTDTNNVGDDDHEEAAAHVILHSAAGWL